MGVSQFSCLPGEGGDQWVSSHSEHTLPRVTGIITGSWLLVFSCAWQATLPCLLRNYYSIEFCFYCCKHSCFLPSNQAFVPDTHPSLQRTALIKVNNDIHFSTDEQHVIQPITASSVRNCPPLASRTPPPSLLPPLRPPLLGPFAGLIPFLLYTHSLGDCILWL